MAKTQHPANRKRAARAERALKDQNYWDCGESYAVTDLLVDLRHLCDRKRWSFDRLLASAANHYDAEHVPDDIEQDSRRLEAAQ